MSKLFLLSCLALGLLACAAHTPGPTGEVCRYGNMRQTNPPPLVTCQPPFKCCGNPDMTGTCQVPDGGDFCT